MKEKNKKNEKEIFCDISFFMKQSGRGGCNGCPRSKECELYYENRSKRNSNNNSNRGTIYISVNNQKY